MVPNAVIALRSTTADRSAAHTAAARTPRDEPNPTTRPVIAAPTAVTPGWSQPIAPTRRAAPRTGTPRAGLHPPRGPLPAGPCGRALGGRARPARPRRGARPSPRRAPHRALPHRRTRRQARVGPPTPPA